MSHHHMEFLSDGGINYRHMHWHISQAFQAIWSVARYRYNGHQASLCCLCRAHEVLRFPACAKDDQQVIRLTKCQDLTGENVLVTVIVCYSGKNRSVSSERENCVGCSLALKAANQFRCKVLCFGSTAPVSRNKYFVPASQRLNEPHSDLRQYHSS